MSEPQNYVWCVNNKITGITIAIYYIPEAAEFYAAKNVDFVVKKMEIKWA